jgi:hypothetical protein
LTGEANAGYTDRRGRFECIATSEWRGVAQLVARGVWDAEVGGSSPLTPTCVSSWQRRCRCLSAAASLCHPTSRLGEVCDSSLWRRPHSWCLPIIRPFPLPPKNERTGHPCSGSPGCDWCIDLQSIGQTFWREVGTLSWPLARVGTNRFPLRIECRGQAEEVFPMRSDADARRAARRAAEIRDESGRADIVSASIASRLLPEIGTTQGSVIVTRFGETLVRSRACWSQKVWVRVRVENVRTEDEIWAKAVSPANKTNSEIFIYDNTPIRRRGCRSRFAGMTRDLPENPGGTSENAQAINQRE